MAETTPPSSPPPIETALMERRIDQIEAGLNHFREITDLRHGHFLDEIKGLAEATRRQADQIEATEEKMLGEIKEIYRLLWRAIGWLGSLLASTMLLLILKAAKLY